MLARTLLRRSALLRRGCVVASLQQQQSRHSTTGSQPTPLDTSAATASPSPSSSSTPASVGAAAASPEDASVRAAVDNAERNTDDANVVWGDYDRANDIKEGFATEGFEDAEVKPEHYALAVRALAYGTVLAVVTVTTLTCCVGRFYYGFTTVHEAVEYIRSSSERAIKKKEAEGVTVYRHSVNLLDPSSWSQTWDAIINDIERIEVAQREGGGNAAGATSSSAAVKQQ
eukprot:Rhum_TRINITY_DN2013_c0_g2::Rhum_TRINITY_DN2013_c0_g2_i1::g.5403::m.5403